MENSYTKYKRYDEDFKRNAMELAGTSGRPMAVTNSQPISVSPGTGSRCVETI